MFSCDIFCTVSSSVLPDVSQCNVKDVGKRRVGWLKDCLHFHVQHCAYCVHGYGKENDVVHLWLNDVSVNLSCMMPIVCTEREKEVM